MKKWVLFLASIALMSLSATAYAQELRAYEAPSPEDQLELDTTAIPDGRGAIFVPSLTTPELEPAIIVTIDGERILVGRTGARIVVPPGQYEVTAGSGPDGRRAQTTVEVRARETTLVEPFFTAIRVQAVDTTGAPERVPYFLSREGELVGTRQTSEDARFSDAEVFFVRPGALTLGLGSVVDRNASSIMIPTRAGDLLNYRLVVEGDRILRAELATVDVDYEPSIWRFRWVVGADGAIDQSTGRIRGYNGTSLRIGVFMEAEVGINTGNHVALLSANLDESWIGFESDYGPALPFQKLTDEVSAELLYNYRLGGIIGPYARVMGSTSFFESTVEFDDETEVIQQETGDSQTFNRGDSLQLAAPFSPTFLQQGAGVSITALDTRRIRVLARGGAAARQSFFRDARYVTDSGDNRLELIDLESANRLGAEFTAQAGLRLTSSLRIDSTLEVFLPQDQVFGGADLRPVYKLSGLANLRITNFASLIYRFSLAREDVQIDGPQIFQGLSLRLQHSFL